MIYPFPQEEFVDLAYFFADAEYEAPYIVNTARWLGKEDGFYMSLVVKPKGEPAALLSEASERLQLAY